MIYTELYKTDLTIAQNSVVNLDKLVNSTILITGGNGMIGSGITDFFLNLNDTRDANNIIYVAARNIDKIMKRFGKWAKRKDFHFLLYEATIPIDSTISFDYIFHAASPASPNAYVKYPVETMLANFEGMYNILNYTMHCSTKRIVFISSSEIYGKQKSNFSYVENQYGYIDILNARACYPSAKRAAETLCISYLQEYNIESVIVRPGHIYGPTFTDADNKAASEFLRSVVNGHDIVMKSSGNQMRSYCYIIDCISAIVSVLLNGKAGEAYNISNPNSIVSIRELANTIAQASGKKVQFDMPSELEEKSYNLMDNSSLCSKKLEALGWKGLFDIQTGVEHTLKILMQNKKGQK